MSDVPPSDFSLENEAREDRLETLKAHPLFFQLSQRRQDFVIAFLQTRNPRRAAQATFHCTDNKTADYQARKVLKSWMVRKILAAVGGFKFDGYPLLLDEALCLASERLRDSSTDVKTFGDLLKFIGRIKGWDKPTTPAKKDSEVDLSEPTVDELVAQMERTNQGQHNEEEI